ncbi:hypothetical protein Scep_016834 [Stephania cephalantha]|uniref:AIR9-like A9 domain-containing protein n=1 Tax=Stephania cephalantha TaxID=152367 RepID=A0AAP0IQ87_9MAGN
MHLNTSRDEKVGNRKVKKCIAPGSLGRTRNSMLKARNPIETSTDSYIPSIPKVVNVKMVGDLRVNKKLVITGDVIEGDERLSIAQLFKTLSKEDNSESDIEAITLPKSGKKEFQLPEEAIDHYIIVIYTPVATYSANGDPICVVSDEVVKSSEKRKVRGKNKNLKVASLKVGETYEVKFYNNRPVSDYRKYWSRHLGIMVRDHTMCPIRVKL